MRLSISLISLAVAFSVTLMSWTAAAQEVYHDGAFTVRKVEGVCKLEIALSTNPSNETNVILALFSSDDYYGELFTEKDSVGLAQQEVDFRFDTGAVVTIPFVRSSEGKDNHWRWQYLENARGLLDDVAAKNQMRMSFRNQDNKMFKTALPLKGSSKAVQSLKSCR